MRKWGHSRLYIVQMPYTHGRNDNQAFQPVQPTTCYGRPSWDTDSVPGTPESILPRMRTPGPFSGILPWCRSRFQCRLYKSHRRMHRKPATHFLGQPLQCQVSGTFHNLHIGTPGPCSTPWTCTDDKALHPSFSGKSRAARKRLPGAAFLYQIHPVLF